MRSYNFGIYPNENFYSYITRVEAELDHKIKTEGAGEDLVSVIVSIFDELLYSRLDFLEEVNRMLKIKIDNPTITNAHQLSAFLRYRLTKKLRPSLEIPSELKYLEQ